LLSANARGKRIGLSTDIKPGIKVFADSNMVNSVIRNITSNAIKFTPENGSVKINAIVLQDKMVEICISDTGIGLKPQDIDKLFRVECQYSTKGTGGESGTGLGLLLCKEFVEHNGGSIRVESEPEKGSRFIFTLPMSDN
jgi:two-component system, sensor histidine kinase and response regulator